MFKHRVQYTFSSYNITSGSLFVQHGHVCITGGPSAAGCRCSCGRLLLGACSELPASRVVHLVCISRLSIWSICMSSSRSRSSMLIQIHSISRYMSQICCVHPSNCSVSVRWSCCHVLYHYNIIGIRDHGTRDRRRYYARSYCRLSLLHRVA